MIVVVTNNVIVFRAGLAQWGTVKHFVGPVLVRAAMNL